MQRQLVCKPTAAIFTVWPRREAGKKNCQQCCYKIVSGDRDKHASNSATTHVASKQKWPAAMQQKSELLEARHPSATSMQATVAPHMWRGSKSGQLPCNKKVNCSKPDTHRPNLVTLLAPLAGFGAITLDMRKKPRRDSREKRNTGCFTTQTRS